jgi:hypothetical protein
MLSSPLLSLPSSIGADVRPSTSPTWLRKLFSPLVGSPLEVGLLALVSSASLLGAVSWGIEAEQIKCIDVGQSVP